MSEQYKELIKRNGVKAECQCEHTGIIIPCYVYAGYLFDKNGNQLKDNWVLLESKGKLILYLVIIFSALLVLCWIDYITLDTMYQL